MKTSRIYFSWLVALAMTLSAVIALPFNVEAQKRTRTKVRTTTTQQTQTSVAYERAYPNGYKNGYDLGVSDFKARTNRDFTQMSQYQRADFGYRTSYGLLAEYQEGYRLGYQMGYVDGYYGRNYATTIPQNALALRTTTTTNQTAGTVYVPDRTMMKLRLDSTLSTKDNRQGDTFKAIVLSPREYENAIVEGHIAKINRSGKMTGKTELSLAFDKITLTNGMTGVLHGEVKELVENEKVKAVDEEGNVQTTSKTKDTVLRSGGGAALGAIIGAIAGGGKGAAIGAAIGAGVGAGSVFVQGDKDLLLEPGAEMTIETSASMANR